MGDRQSELPRGRGGSARGQSKMRMDNPVYHASGKRKREEEGDPVLHLLSLVLRIGDRLRVSCLSAFVVVLLALPFLRCICRKTPDLWKKSWMR